MLPALWAPLQAGVRASVPALVLQSGMFNKLLLLLLMVLSISTWAVIVERFRLLGRVRRADRAFRAAFQTSASLAEVRLLASQHPASLQVVERREQLLAGQVAGHAEDHQDVTRIG